jgi:hypothetical protein
MKKSTIPQISLLIMCIVVAAMFFIYKKQIGGEIYTRDTSDVLAKDTKEKEVVPVLDNALYDKKLEQLANNPPDIVATSSATSTVSLALTKDTLWPVKTTYPNYGALLPFNRIVAYYGNFYSKKMGVLGEYPEDVMLEKLRTEVASWKAADPSTSVIPAIHYIAATAQVSPGKDNKYVLQMPFSEIDKSIALAKKVNGIVFLDLQIGNSDVMAEVQAIDSYLVLPYVHLGIDPEFAMKPGDRPGQRIGTIDARDINLVIEKLATIVRDNNLPPKILVIHRFTKDMVTNYKDIRPLPEVQIVMDMDGWGDIHLKLATYNAIIYQEPVQFTGFKLFYKNDIRAPGSRMLTPEEILKLRPIPSYIQYQ